MKKIRKKILSVCLVMALYISVIPATSWTAEALTLDKKTVTVSNLTVYANGNIKSIDAGFMWPNDNASANVQVVLTSKNLGNNLWNEYHQNNSYFSFEESTEAAGGVLAASDTEIVTLGGQMVNDTFEFADGILPIAKDAEYYVYIWTHWKTCSQHSSKGGCYYPDALIAKIRVKDKVVSYTTDVTSSNPEYSDVEGEYEEEHVHDLTFVSKKTATCTTSGMASHYICSNCGKVFDDAAGKNETTLESLNIPAKGHTFVSGTAVEPTCIKAGLTAGIKCKTCGQVKEAQKEIAPLGHEWSDDWVVIEPATADKTGKKKITCVRGCGQTKIEEIPALNVSDKKENLKKDAEVAPDVPIKEVLINNSREEILKADNIFTEQEKAAIESGEQARVWLEITKTDESMLSDSDKAQMQEQADNLMGKQASMTYFDADLYKKVGNTDTSQIYEPGEHIRITITIPAELLNHDTTMARDYKIIRLHEDQNTGTHLVDVLDGVFNEETKEFTFETDKFSTYALAYNDTPVATGVIMQQNSVTLTKNGESTQLTAIVTPEDAKNKEVTWESSDSNVAIVDENGLVTAVGNGTAVITVTTVDGKFTATCVVTVAIAITPTATPEPTEAPAPTVTPEPTEAPAPTATPEPTEVPASSESPIWTFPLNTSVQTTPAPTESTAVTETKNPEKVSKTQRQKNAIALNAGLKATQVGNSIDIVWGELKQADGYHVYVQYCGEKFTKKSVTEVKKGTKISIKKINGKSLNLARNYKFYIEGYKVVDGKKVSLGRTFIAHVTGRNNTKETNVKAIVLKQKAVTLKKGTKTTIQAETVLEDASKKALTDDHALEFRFASDNIKVATVTKSGQIKALAKGTCNIYVYARNGYAKKVKVTVK